MRIMQSWIVTIWGSTKTFFLLFNVLDFYNVVFNFFKFSETINLLAALGWIKKQLLFVAARTMAAFANPQRIVKAARNSTTLAFGVRDLSKNSNGLVEVDSTATHLSPWLAFAFLLYAIGLYGRIVNRTNFIVTRRSVERRYLGVITSFVIHGTTTNDSRGPIYGLLLVILAACEAAIGLGLVIVLHRFSNSLRFDDYTDLGG